jgi:hypothetical protein
MKDITMRKAKLPHPVIGLMQMIIGILTPMEDGDRDFAKDEVLKLQKKTHLRRERKH